MSNGGFYWPPPEIAAEAAAKRAAAVRAAEAAAESWHRSAAGRWQEISVPALAELLILMGSVGPGAGIAELEPNFRRRSPSIFDGALYLMGELIWQCWHGHAYVSEARECAIREARYREQQASETGQEREVG